MQKEDVVRALNFGERVAELEQKKLADYFVETLAWTDVASGEKDVVLGPKGSGKSAIYTVLMNKREEFSSRGIHLVSAENTRGSTVFQDIKADPATSENAFAALWKLYFLSLIGSSLAELDVDNDHARKVKDSLAQEHLIPAQSATLATRFKMVWEWIARRISSSSHETNLSIDPSTAMPSLTYKISPNEPSVAEREQGVESLDDLLRSSSMALEQSGKSIWILFDRLDIAFVDSPELEGNAIRALFRTYLDIADYEHLSVKIFLRSDIWDSILRNGFREASHVTKRVEIKWAPEDLLNLVVRRILDSNVVADFYDVNRESVLADSKLQRSLFDCIVPDKVDAGKNPRTFEWILGRVQDGSAKPAPREVIHLLTEAREEQIRMFERGDAEPPGKEIITRSALRAAMGPVSKVRLEQTIYAEYPKQKSWIVDLESEKTDQTIESLAKIWDVSEGEAQVRAQRLADIGFWEVRGRKREQTFWVPFLYRPALSMRQGRAE